MERVLQYWDELDDLYFALVLMSERFRRFAVMALIACMVGAAEFGAIALALREPPLALAAATLLTVTLLYRSATRPYPATP